MLTAFRIVAALACVAVSLSGGVVLAAVFGVLAGVNVGTIIIDRMG